MSYNGSGTFQINSTGQPVVAETLIEAATFNAFTADVATGLSNAICKDGQTTVTANIPFGGYKLTGVGAATARTDAATLASIQDGTGVYVATVGGTADVITLTPSPPITAYAAGQTFRFIASGANTTNVTVNVSSLGAKAITKNGTTALAAGDIPSGAMVEITYDGTRFILGTVGAATVPAGAVPTGAATSSGLTMATARLLGRTTASTGAIEEISAGNALTLSGGSLAVDAASESADGTIEIATEAEIEAGSSNTLAVTPGRLKGAIGFSAYYESSGQTITAGGALTLAHGLGRTPILVTLELVCTDAGGDIGYTQNQRVHHGMSNSDGDGSAGQKGCSVVVDSTNLTVRFASGTNTFWLPNATTGAAASITNTKWQAVFRAWG